MAVFASNLEASQGWSKCSQEEKNKPSTKRSCCSWMSALKPTWPTSGLTCPDGRLAKCVAGWQGASSIPLAYLDGFDLDFAQVHFLDLQKCCWSVHLEAHFSAAELVAQTRQICHSPSLLNETTEIPALCSGMKTWVWLQSNPCTSNNLMQRAVLTWRVGAFGYTFRLLWCPKNIRGHLVGFSRRCCIIFISPKQVTWTTSRRPQNPAEDTKVWHHFIYSPHPTCRDVGTCFDAPTTETKGDLNTDNNNRASIGSINRLSCLLYCTRIGVKTPTFLVSLSKCVVLEKRRPDTRERDAAVSGVEAEQPGLLFHTSAGAADNACSVSIQANSVSVPTQAGANTFCQMFDNYRKKQMSGLSVKVVAEGGVAKTFTLVTEQ